MHLILDIECTRADTHTLHAPAQESVRSLVLQVMRIADGKVRNAESFEQRAKAAEDARAALEARIKSLEEQLDV